MPKNKAKKEDIIDELEVPDAEVVVEKEETSDRKQMFVKKKIWEYVHSNNMNISGDVLNGGKLSVKITAILDDAMQRAKDNKRKTVKEKDL